MKNIIFLVFSLSCYINQLNAQTPLNDKNWGTSPKWYDEFTYTNFNRFTHRPIWICNTYSHCANLGSMSGCNMYLTDESDNGHNFTFDATNGIMTISAIHESSPFTPGNSSYSGNTYNYTSSLLNSITGNFNQIYIKYGYLEIRMRVPQLSTSAIGATFWSNSYDPVLDRRTEFDIIEMNEYNYTFTCSTHLEKWSTHTWYNYDNDFYDYPGQVGVSNTYNSGSACTPNNPIHKSKASQLYFPSVDFTQNSANNYGWHTFGLEWGPSKAIFYIDDKPVKTTYADFSTFLQTGLYITLTPGGFSSIINDCLQLVSTSSFPSTQTFPYNLELDFVRVWKLNMDDCSGSTLVLSKLDPSTYTYGVKSAIQITGTSNTVLSSGDKVSLRASNTIEIDKNFEAPIGAEFMLIPTPCE